MYEDFFGLKEKPFNLTPDPKFLFLSEKHQEALNYIHYGIRQKEGFILIAGDIGTGKTTICRALFEEFDEKTKTAYIFNPLISEEELLSSILQDFGVPPTGKTKKELVDQLNVFLLEQHAQGRIAVLIIDEAQTLSPLVMEEVRLLSNLETAKEKLLQITFFGQLELLKKLELAELRQLNQRISTRYVLKPLNREETERYIQHRLMVAGARGDLSFTPGAIDEIFKFSQGVPRLINMACDRALLAGFVRQISEKRIDAEFARLGIESLTRDEPMIQGAPSLAEVERPGPRPEEKVRRAEPPSRPVPPPSIRRPPAGRRKVMYGAVVGVVVLGGLASLWGTGFFQNATREASSPTQGETPRGGGGSQAAPTPAAAPQAKETEAPHFAIRELPFSLQVIHLKDFGRARDFATTLTEKGYQAYVVPVILPGVGEGNRTMVGAFEGIHEAEAQLEGMLKSRIVSQGRVVFTRYAFYLADVSDQSRVEARRDELLRQEIPTYYVTLLSTTGQPVYRLFAGAFETKEQSEFLKDRLIKAGIQPRLVKREG